MPSKRRESNTKGIPIKDLFSWNNLDPKDFLDDYLHSLGTSARYPIQLYKSKWETSTTINFINSRSPCDGNINDYADLELWNKYLHNLFLSLFIWRTFIFHHISIVYVFWIDFFTKNILSLTLRIFWRTQKWNLCDENSIHHSYELFFRTRDWSNGLHKTVWSVLMS